MSEGLGSRGAEAVLGTALGLSVAGCTSADPASPTSSGGTRTGKAGGYTLTVENANARCAYATVKLRREDGAAKGTQSGVVYSDAFSGGKVSLSDQHYGDDGEATTLPQGEFEARAYLSRPVGDYTAVVRGADGRDMVTVRFHVAKTAEGKQRSAFPYLTEPSIFVDGEAMPGERVKVTVHDEGPDPEEKTVTMSSAVFETPAKLTYLGKAYEGEATIREDAKPGRHEVRVANHFGCGKVTGTIEVSD